MDQYKLQIIEKRIRKTMANLEKHNMAAYFAKTKEEAVEIATQLISPGEVIGSGGSRTLTECGMMDVLRSGKYQFIDRNIPGVTPEQSKALCRQCFSANSFFMSCNAITETGELYNVDGNSNRVAALAYGPDQVIIIAGYNKIVPDIEAAITRVKKWAAPCCASSSGFPVPCATTGECVNCLVPRRMCCNHLVTGFQREKNRVKVILVAEELGY